MTRVPARNSWKTRVKTGVSTLVSEPPTLNCAPPELPTTTYLQARATIFCICDIIETENKFYLYVFFVKNQAS